LNTPTNKPIAAALPLPVSYHVFLPPAPGHGRIPVVIYGHGLSDNQFGAPTYIASTLASQGFATLAIEIPGHGFGPASHVKITNSDNSTSIVLTPGRGGKLLQSTPISSDDGCVVSGPLAVRDCARQTAVDLFALVHAIQQTNGLGLNLDPNRIYYIGQSFGGTYGTLLRALEPGVKKAVLNGAGGSSVDVARFAVTGRMIATSYLLGVSPALFNVPPAPAPPYFRNLPFMQPQFNDEYVFRNPGVTVHSTDDGALQIQGAFEVADWLHMPGDPLSYAAKLPVGSTLFQFGLGDLEVPNPAESAVVRTANAKPYTWLFHFEIAGSIAPELFGISTPDTGGLPILPHRILSNPTIFADPAETSVALAEQKQAASFFNGAANPDANQFLTAPYTGVPLFENPPATLPDTLGFFQITP
ncbi:MAG TPA: hypothetical protein VHB50_11110, partial [Bryobacteraceae bacterium]|nr:hypothetical protein [Bryobacteraceae bacterium]